MESECYNVKKEPGIKENATLQDIFVTQDMFKTHDYHSLSQKLEPKSVRRHSQIKISEAVSPVAGQSVIKKPNARKPNVNSVQFSAEDQEHMIAQALQMHRLSYQQNATHSGASEGGHLDMPWSSGLPHKQPLELLQQEELAEIKTFQRIIMRNQGQIASRSTKRQTCDSTKTGANHSQQNPASSKKGQPTWLPQTHQFINDLIQGSQQGGSTKKTGQQINILGPAQLLSTQSCRKPFQLKPRNLFQAGNPGGAGQNTTSMQGCRDSLGVRLAMDALTSNGVESAQPSSLSSAQPYNVLQTAANQCFQSQRESQVLQTQLNQNILNDQSITIPAKFQRRIDENHDSILIKGVKKGLQPQIGRNLPIESEVQTGLVFQDELILPQQRMIDPYPDRSSM